MMTNQPADNLLADFTDHISFAHRNGTTVRTINRYRAQGLPWIRWNGRVLDRTNAGGAGLGAVPREPHARCRVMTAAFADTKFVWRGLSLHLGRRSTPVLTLVTDAAHPHLYRIRYRNGWTSTPANLTRARDAAYGHARYLLVSGTAHDSPTAAEGQVVVHGAT